MTDTGSSLVCPGCKSGLEKEENALKCRSCGGEYKIISGIPSFCEFDGFYEGKFDITYDDSQSCFTRPAFLPRFLRKALFDFLILNQINNKRKKFILKKARGGEKVLDIGCGGGKKWLLNYGTVTGLDISLSSLGNARHIYDDVIHSTLERLPFPDGCFDTVIGIDIFGHIEPDKKDIVLGELKRVLRPGGRMVAVVEADSDSMLFRWMKKDNKLYTERMIELDGHIGLEKPLEVIARFKRLGFTINYRKTIYGIVLPTWEYEKLFSGGYDEKSLTIKILTRLNSRLDRLSGRLSKMLAHLLFGYLDSITMAFTGFNNGHILLIEVIKEK